MSKYVIIDIKEGTCVPVGSKKDLSKMLSTSIPTLNKHFAGKDVNIFEWKIVGRMRELRNESTVDVIKKEVDPGTNNETYK